MGNENQTVWRDSTEYIPSEKTKDFCIKYAASIIDKNNFFFSDMSSSIEVKHFTMKIYSNAQEEIRKTERYKKFLIDNNYNDTDENLSEWIYRMYPFTASEQRGLVTRQFIPAGTIFLRAKNYSKLINDLNYQYFMPQNVYSNEDNIAKNINVRSIYLREEMKKIIMKIVILQ